MGKKPCTISAREKAASDKAAINALDGALQSGAGAILDRIAARSHRVMRAWIEAGRPNSRAAIDRIVREIDRS